MKAFLFTYVLTYGGALLSLYNPFVGLLIYVGFAIVRPEFLWFWAFEPGHNFSRIVASALVAGWVLQWVMRGAESPFTLGRARLAVAGLAAAWAWALLSGALAPDQAVANQFIEYLTKIVLPVLIGISLIDSMAKLKALAWVIVLSQAYVALEMNFTYLDGYNRLFLDGVGGMDNNSAAIAMVTCLGPAFLLGLYADLWWQRALAFASAAVLGHAVLFSFSRGGTMAMILTAVAALLLVRPSLRHYLALTAAVVLGLRLAGPEVRERFLTVFATEAERDASAQSRLDLWNALWDVIQKHPLFGAGPDHWPLLAESYGFPAGKEGHSLWLQWAAEMGVPGLVFLLLFYGACAWRLWPLARGREPGQDPWLGHLANVVILSLIGFAISAQFVSLKLLEVPYYVALLGVGTLKMASAPAAAPERLSWNVLAVPGSV